MLTVDDVPLPEDVDADPAPINLQWHEESALKPKKLKYDKRWADGVFVKEGFSIVDVFNANVEKAKEEHPRPMPVQYYKHETTEAEFLAKTQPIVDLKAKQQTLKIIEEDKANDYNKHVKIGTVKPTIWEERDDIRIVKGGAIASTRNAGQPEINETDNDPSKIKELNLETKYNLKEAYDRWTKKDI